MKHSLIDKQIGKTSSLVLTLSGVFKNILIIFTSVLIWGTIISSLQVLGYLIALVALTYYSIGWEGVKAILPSAPQSITSLASGLRTCGKGRTMLLTLVAGFLVTVSLLSLWVGGVRPYRQGVVTYAAPARDSSGG